RTAGRRAIPRSSALPRRVRNARRPAELAGGERRRASSLAPRPPLDMAGRHRRLSTVLDAPLDRGLVPMLSLGGGWGGADTVRILDGDAFVVIGGKVSFARPGSARLPGRRRRALRGSASGSGSGRAVSGRPVWRWPPPGTRLRRRRRRSSTATATPSRGRTW